MTVCNLQIKHILIDTVHIFKIFNIICQLKSKNTNTHLKTNIASVINKIGKEEKIDKERSTSLLENTLHKSFRIARK